MKHPTMLLLTLTSLCVFGQEKTKKAAFADFKRVQIGVNVSPDICFRTLKNNDGSSSSDYVIRGRNNNEVYKVGYTAGLNVCFNLKRSFGLESGIQYSNKGYQTRFTELTFGQSDPNIPLRLKAIFNFHYIDIPLKANLTLGEKRVRFFTSFGLTTNVLILETITGVLVYSDRKDKKTDPTNVDYNRVNISPTISLGIDYKINSKMNLRIEPTFRYGVLSIIDAPVTGYLFNGGLNIAYYFGI